MVALGEIKVAVSGLFRLLFRVLFRVQVSESCFNFDSVFNSVFNSVFEWHDGPGIFRVKVGFTHTGLMFHHMIHDDIITSDKKKRKILLDCGICKSRKPMLRN